jgi:hypothetical protein
MKLATAPVNWNSPDVPEYRAWTPYPQLLDAYFQSLGASYLIAADSGDARRVQEAGRVNPTGGLTEAQWASLGAVEKMTHEG